MAFQRGNAAVGSGPPAFGSNGEYAPKQVCRQFRLPLRVRVSAGFYGAREDQSLSEGEQLTVLGERIEDIVVALDRHGRRVDIPLTDDASFVVIEEHPKPDVAPPRRTEDCPAIDGPALLTDLIARHSLPLLVRLADADMPDHNMASRSSGQALLLQRTEKLSSVVAACDANAEDLLCIPEAVDGIMLEPANGAKRLDKAEAAKKHADPVYVSIPDDAPLRGIGRNRFSSRRYRRTSVVSVSNDGYIVPSTVETKTVGVKSISGVEPSYATPSKAPSKPVVKRKLKPVSETDQSSESSSSARAQGQSRARTSTMSHETLPSHDEIASMSCEDVAALLQKMNLGQYRPKFLEQQIDGPLLLELDEGMLEDDLGVTSRLHRLRLQRLIDRPQ